jgi:lipid II:glycine glycyltransferase (peptidoglycan interpeptide bridge formation enzyme)
MEIEIQQNFNRVEWSGNLNDFNFSLFITPPWIESVKSDLQRPIYLDFISQGESIAKIAGFSFDTGFTFQRKLFFYAGPAVRKNMPEATSDDCIETLVKFTKKNRYARMVLLSYDYKYISACHKNYGFSLRSEFIINLIQDKEIINKNISRNVKRSIKKALNQGYELKETNAEQMLEHLVHLMQETRRIRLSKHYSDYNYFYLPGFTLTSLKNLIKEKAVHFYYIEKYSKILAVQAIIQYNQKAYALFIGVDEEGYKNGVPSFMDYSVVTLLKNNNYEYLNFGGVPTDKTHHGIAHFKEMLGAVEVFSSYGSTNFLIFPYYLLNPLIKRIRKLQDNSLLNFIKKSLNL